MKKIKKIYIFIVIVISVLLLLEKTSQAMTQEEAGNYIANYTLNYYEKHGEETAYTTNNQARIAWYNGQKVNGKYSGDCVAFITIMLHNSTGWNNRRPKRWRI